MNTVIKNGIWLQLVHYKNGKEHWNTLFHFPLCVSVCTCVYACAQMHVKFSAGGNCFHTFCVCVWFLGGGCGSTRRRMRCAAEPQWMGVGKRGERHMLLVHAVFLKPHHAMKGTNLCLRSVHYMYLCPFPVIWRNIMQFRRFIGMLVFHQNTMLHPMPALLWENGVSSQQFLDVLLVQQLNIRKSGTKVPWEMNRCSDRDSLPNNAAHVSDLLSWSILLVKICVLVKLKKKKLNHDSISLKRKKKKRTLLNKLISHTFLKTQIAFWLVFW